MEEYYEEKRESYCSMSKEQFLDPATGPFKRLDNTAWYIKKARQRLLLLKLTY